ncbi:MAG: hypothetical protein NW237_08685 [Cyanobacteriota bacterium]|nr:hypothetical protein [Cyanobacteriota bacterium]
MMRRLASVLLLTHHLVAWSLFSTSISYAQEFDFTKPTVDTSTVNPTAADPNLSTMPAEGTIPTLPILPESQEQVVYSTPLPSLPLDPTLSPSQPLPPVPNQAVISNPVDPAIPVVPVAPAATSDAYTYQRQPGIAPGSVADQASRGELAPGTMLPLTVYREITFPPFQAINGNLEVSEPVVDRFGQVVIPAGSVVWGTFEPVVEKRRPLNSDGDNAEVEDKLIGTRFVANRVTVQTSTYLLNGQSDLLPMGMDPQADLGTTVVRGAGYGAAGGLALGILTGGFGLLPIVAGSMAGAAAGTTNIDRVVTLKPNTIVNIELSDHLIIQ